MLTSISIANYRSILDLTLALGRLNVITGANGSGKSNLYKALRLLASTAHGGVVSSLASEGGLASTFWAGPKEISASMLRGEFGIDPSHPNYIKRLKLGFATEDLGYAVSLGLPEPTISAFCLDPEIKQECIFTGARYHPNSSLVERQGNMIRNRDGRRWEVLSSHIANYDSMFDQVGESEQAPEVLQMREMIRGWRFYDHFRTDRDAPARQSQLGTRTTMLHHDGRDLAAALQTIIEIGDREALEAAIEDAFPGCRLTINCEGNGYFSLAFYQHGLLRPLSGSELSDGTLRFILWVAALLTPRPPTLMVLNEPETSLHPDLLPALGRLIHHAASHGQVWVISHAEVLIKQLATLPECQLIEIEKVLGETTVPGRDILDIPTWRWPK